MSNDLMKSVEEQRRDNSTIWIIILAVVLFFFCCCCLILLLAGWFLGDVVVNWIRIVSVVSSMPLI